MKTYNLNSIWNVYRLLEPSISPISTDDEITYIMEHAQDGTMLQAVCLVYDQLPDNINPFTIALLFLRGMDEINLVDFIEFIRALSHGK